MWVFTVIALATIFGLVAASTHLFFVSAFLAESSEQFKTIQGAFLGAFFAFLFIRIADVLTEVYERFSRDRNQLVKYHHLLNQYLGELHDNIFAVDGLSEMVRGMKLDGPVHVWFGQLNPHQLDREGLVQLINLALINDLTSLNLHLRKINDAILSLNVFSSEIRSGVTQGHIDLATYIGNVRELEKQAQIIKAFSLRVIDEILDLGAKTRLLLERDTVFGTILRKTFPKNYPKWVIRKLPGELERQRNEIEEIGRKSQERVEGVLKDAGTLK